MQRLRHQINFGSMPATNLTSAQTSTAVMGGLFTYTCSPGSNTPALTAGQGNNYQSPNNRMKGATNNGFLPYSSEPALDRHLHRQRADRANHGDDPSAGDASRGGYLYRYSGADAHLLIDPTLTYGNPKPLP